MEQWQSDRLIIVRPVFEPWLVNKIHVRQFYQTLGWHHPIAVVLGALTLLGSCTGMIVTGSCPVSNLANPEGTSVTLNMAYKSAAAADIYVVEWECNELILRYYPDKKLVVQSLYKGRVMFNNNTFSLELMNLQTNDSGFYNGVVTHKKKGRICGAKYNLSVLAPCSVTNLSRSEGTSVSLSIGYKSIAAAEITSVEWFKGKFMIIRYYPGMMFVVQPSYKSRVKFDNSTFSLELMNLQKEDSGSFYGVITETNGTICPDQYLLSVVDSTSEERGNSAQITNPVYLSIMVVSVLVLLNIAF